VDPYTIFDDPPCTSKVTWELTSYLSISHKNIGTIIIIFARKF